jgi:hypothetical protein
VKNHHFFPKLNHHEFNPIHQDIFAGQSRPRFTQFLGDAWTQLPSSSQASLRDAAPPYLARLRAFEAACHMVKSVAQ